MVNMRNNCNGQGGNTNNQVNSQFEQLIAKENQLMRVVGVVGVATLAYKPFNIYSLTSRPSSSNNRHHHHPSLGWENF
jgi:hypothetical protein